MTNPSNVFQQLVDPTGTRVTVRQTELMTDGYEGIWYIAKLGIEGTYLFLHRDRDDALYGEWEMMLHINRCRLT